MLAAELKLSEANDGRPTNEDISAAVVRVVRHALGEQDQQRIDRVLPAISVLATAAHSFSNDNSS